MFLREPLSSSTYNTLPLINDNTVTLSPDELALLGNIIKKHGMEDRFGVHYLHRHFAIPTGHILASSATASGVEIHVPVASSEHEHYRGTHYIINSDGTFQPYEFDDTMEADKTSGTAAVNEFLKNFADTVLAHGLHNQVALRIDHDQMLRREVTGEGWTVHFPCNMAGAKCLDQASIPVGWKWEAGGAGAAKTVGIWTPSGANKETGHNVTPTASGDIEPLIARPMTL
ncbi:hypothetical protein LTR56_014654 [Elasticomyces elasticus]|nr:hypothetical protein LTR56_014654 [Elasticomyces elasticus]KAK3645331.1 hypothetical protein LTR22_014796 [Elasticomyces elasticus]KAK4919828.1 hypothetical protein LTR49_012575 [Elasticomyces elasticus]KAK5750102.1 hypothetical protein LTS12_019828 [Elasticomyces elasticus]